MLDLNDLTLSAYDYELPPEFIAQEPIEPRHNARLMVIREPKKDITTRSDLKIWNLLDELRAGDLLVLNNTRVIKARLRVRLSTGGLAELFVLEPLKDGCWVCLGRPAKKMQPGDNLVLEKNDQKPIALKVVSIDASTEGRVVRFPSCYSERKKIEELLNVYGEVPLPPYIKRNKPSDEKRYQTCFAEHPGAVAAPTAGLHLSHDLLDSLRYKGVRQASITLHVGLGTFRPLKTEDLTDLELHSEWVDVNAQLVTAVRDCQARGGRVFAVGTTSVRALEGAFQKGNSELKPMTGKVNLVIKPGYKFGVVDGLLTNFHLPKSSLLLLISAFIGRKRLLTLYEQAIKSQYRFYSYGDAMLITPEAVLAESRY